MNAMKAFLVGKVYGFIKTHSLITASTLFVLVVACVAVIVFNVGGKEESATAGTTEGTGQEVSIEGSEEDDVQDLTLQCDAYPEINQVMEAYHKALAEYDEATIQKYLLYVNENELVNILVKSEYVEGYQDIHCYTQEGFEAGSYYVYVSYQLKLVNFDTTIPGLIGLYYCPNEEGEYHIYRKADMSENVLDNYYSAYMKQEVQDLYNTVDLNYNEIIDSNPDMKEYMAGFEEMVKEEMVKLIAIREASENMVASSESSESESTSASEVPSENQETPVTETVRATTTVNVRSSDSENADKLGKVTTGTTLTRIEELVNGWSKVLYEGQEGYIKSEYLEVVSTEGGDDAPTGYVTVKENVNIRASASETADRVALAYQGTKLELIEHMSNGWTKVNYNGETAYVKSEYVE